MLITVVQEYVDASAASRLSMYSLGQRYELSTTCMRDGDVRHERDILFK